VQPFTAVLADEVNVKQVRVLDPADAAQAQVSVSQALTVNARAAGPRLGKQVQDVIRASKSGDWSVDPAGGVTCGGIALAEGEFTLQTVVEGGEGAHLAVSVLPGGGFVVLDTGVDDELEAEGWVRDVIRTVQDQRKAAGLHVADRIRLRLAVPATRKATAEGWLELLRTETLATEVELVAADGDEVVPTVEKAE
jgi:isoleucyl-tRNA synthetase